jgi:DNA-binding LacI/PurR family transcriptional regulator
VARLAGVSHQTVSRVINNVHGVAEVTRQRVEISMQQLGYRPSRTATALATNRSRTVGIICTDTGRFGAPKALRTIERAARDAGYYLSTANVTTITPESLSRALEYLEDQNIEGLIVIAPQATMVDHVLAAPIHVPVVAVEATGRATEHSVAIDNRLGARNAVEFLISLGHTRIAHLSGPLDWLDAQERVAGWREALEQRAFPASAPVVGDWSPKSGEAAAEQIIARSATAVFCANDAMALGLFHGLRLRGLDVPDDISVVGFDDIPESAYFSPPLTTMSPDYSDLGHRCVSMLLNLLDGKAESSSLIKPRLIRRASTSAQRNSIASG